VRIILALVMSLFVGMSVLAQTATSAPAGPEMWPSTAPTMHTANAPVIRPTPPGPSYQSAPSRPISVKDAVILGVVEGLTEYLPVSSTGHLILAGTAMGLTEQTNEPGLMGKKLKKNDAIDSFDIVIQLGAILAVLGLYSRRVGQMALGAVGGATALLRGQDVNARLDVDQKAGLKLLGLLMVAFMPAAIVGLLTHKWIEANLFGPLPVAYALAIGGVLMIVVEFWYRRTPGRTRITSLDQMNVTQALFIGLMQVLSMWPGTSRSMITIVAALIIGLDMLAAAEFSFLLALPTLGAATLYSAYKHHNELMQAAGPIALTVGVVVSAITAAIAVKAFVKWLTRHGLTPFGVYRILLAGALLWYLSGK